MSTKTDLTKTDLTKINWIPIKERKPDMPKNARYVECLVYDAAYGIMIAYYRPAPKRVKEFKEGELVFFNTGIGMGMAYPEITHWIPLSDIPLPEKV